MLNQTQLNLLSYFFRILKIAFHYSNMISCNESLFNHHYDHYAREAIEKGSQY